MDKKSLDEERDRDVIDQWRQKSRDMTMKDLPEFLRHLSEDFEHDYGTICHAIAAAGVAAMRALDRTPEGGITGFQAACIMWEIIVGWRTEYRGKPLKLVNYEKMLFPQYEHAFQKRISPDTWEWLRKQAREKLDEEEGAAPGVLAHWQAIVAGQVPFGYRVSEEIE
jgi:hypothetical protein